MPCIGIVESIQLNHCIIIVYDVDGVELPESTIQK